MQNFVEDGRYFEYCAILNTSDAGAILVNVARYGRYAAADRPKRVQNDACVVFLHPLGVVAFLRHGSMDFIVVIIVRTEYY
jgi:hypothetical protein